MWIKAEKPVDKTGEVTSQAQNKKHLSPSTKIKIIFHHFGSLAGFPARAIVP
jgi:hypothetical protein